MVARSSSIGREIAEMRWKHVLKGHVDKKASASTLDRKEWIEVVRGGQVRDRA